MTLHLVGLGLGVRNYLTLKALEIMEEADILILDTYTSWIHGDLLKMLKDRFGGRLRLADRRMLEEDVKHIVEMASKKEVALLIPGDPLVATTHITILLEAVKHGVPYTLNYGVSIYSTVASASGLQAYKFGRTTTIPKSGVGVESCYRVIAENMEHGLHTLLLLDTADGGLTAPEALKLLQEAEKEIGRGIISEDRLLIVLARLGSEDEERWAGAFSEALTRTYPPPPHSIIFPGELHFIEAETLQKLFSVERELIEGHKPVRCERLRVQEYLRKAENAFKTMRIKSAGKNVEKVLEIAESYLNDARIFFNRGELFNALGAIAYCEGLLDALRDMGGIEFEWG